MPPQQWSRFALSTAVPAGVDASKTILSERVPFGYVEEPDNILHTVQAGDSLFTIAARYYAPLQRPAGLFWVIADFQPEPIHDPTIQLTPGTVIYVPSLRLVQTEIFAEIRRVTVSVGS